MSAGRAGGILEAYVPLGISTLNRGPWQGNTIAVFPKNIINAGNDVSFLYIHEPNKNFSAG